MKWRHMLEQNGELNDATRTLLRLMERYTTSVGCRHRHLSAYFGDPYAKDDCAACDVCLGELEPRPEPVVIARKILSCVVRVGQRFGATHVASVLRGQTTSRSSRAARQAQHVRSARRRIGRRGARLHRAADRPRPAPADRRCVSGVAGDGEGHDAVQGSERARGWRWRGSGVPKKGEARQRSRAESESWEGVDRTLFERLRSRAPRHRARAACRHT